jgi:hypothetical protein
MMEAGEINGKGTGMVVEHECGECDVAGAHRRSDGTSFGHSEARNIFHHHTTTYDMPNLRPALGRMRGATLHQQRVVAVR